MTSTSRPATSDMGLILYIQKASLYRFPESDLNPGEAPGFPNPACAAGAVRAGPGQVPPGREGYGPPEM